ncbi:10525_t:CDS:1, partial [Racocetra persica]
SFNKSFGLQLDFICVVPTVKSVLSISIVTAPKPFPRAVLSTAIQVDKFSPLRTLRSLTLTSSILMLLGSSLGFKKMLFQFGAR